MRESQSTFVFLGPSLDLKSATTLIDAEFRPPARLGSIYEILAWRPSLIVIIDGVFHGPASIWQREILDALDEGVTLIGAASMGALRACELAPLGMTGVGQIFEWYRDDIIDGDDEVALIHLDEHHQFRALSEPLVNLRFNLNRAVEEQVVDQTTAHQLIAAIRDLPFPERTRDQLWETAVFKTLQQQAQNTLQTFLDHHWVDLKRADAIEALEYAAQYQESRKTQPMPASDDRNRYYLRHGLERRGFQTAEATRHGRDLLAQTKAGEPKTTRRFFTLTWAETQQLTINRQNLQNVRDRHLAEAVAPRELDDWLRANGLTKREYDLGLRQQTLIEQAAEQVQRDFPEQTAGLQALDAYLGREEDRTTRQRRGEVLAAWRWASEHGVVIPAAQTDVYREAWEREQQFQNDPAHTLGLSSSAYRDTMKLWLTVRWLIMKGPQFFGFVYDAPFAQIRQAQISGEAASWFQDLSS